MGAAFLFWLIAGVTGASALMVLLTTNIVRAAAWLLFTLAGVSGLFFLLGADFIGATQLLVYVGGTLVLVVFGVMLTAQGPFINMRISAAEWAISLGAGLLLYGVLAVSLLGMDPPVPLAEAKAAHKEASGDEKTLVASKHWGSALLGDVRVTRPADVTGLPKGAAFVDRTRVSYLLP